MFEDKQFAIGDRVRIVALPPYVKTAEPMPMLRPPNIIHIGEEGIVIDRRPGGYWSVRFTKGAFLIESQYIEVVFETLKTPSMKHATETGVIPVEESKEE
jgi:hypothetical protein